MWGEGADSDGDTYGWGVPPAGGFDYWDPDEVRRLDAPPADPATLSPMSHEYGLRVANQADQIETGHDLSAEENNDQFLIVTPDCKMHGAICDTTRFANTRVRHSQMRHVYTDGSGNGLLEQFIATVQAGTTQRLWVDGADDSDSNGHASPWCYGGVGAGRTLR